MKVAFVLIGISSSLVLASGVIPASQEKGPTDEKPKTVSQAVDILKTEIGPEALEWIRFTPESEVVSTFHFTLGMSIRNRFGLWSGNRELLEACGGEKMHPDDASSVILKTLWARLRSQLSPNERVDCDHLYQLAEETQIEVEPIRGQTMEEVASKLESALNKAASDQGRIVSVTLGSGVERNTAASVVIGVDALESTPARPAPVAEVLMRITVFKYRLLYKPNGVFIER